MTETQEAAYLEPLKERMAAVEKDIQDGEDKLRELRKERTAIGYALRTLDPRWAANHNPKQKAKRSGPSELQIEHVGRLLKERFDPGEIFDAEEAAKRTELHVTTVHKAVKVLHERGALRLDHMGGVRNNKKYWRLVTDA